MDWVNSMNEAVDYIESHLTGEIDYDEISKITACSYTVFQRTFTQITGISLSEYIRRRRLTCAAYELQNTDDRVIDISQKYGYESSDAFSAAFKHLHGVSPLTARKNDVKLKLTFYCRLRLAITIKGIDKMDYSLVHRDAFKVIGKRRTTPYGGGTWAIVKSDGSAEAMKELSGHICDIGLCFGFGEDGSNDYMCGIEWEKEDIPGFESYIYPANSWLIFEAEGKISDQVLNHVWQRINNEFLPLSKYKKSGLPTIEKYVIWDDAADMCKVEISVPIAKK